MNATTIIPSTDSLARAINAEYLAAERSSRTAVEHALSCGSLLLQAKGEIPHGEWEKWINANVHFSLRTAQQYMNLTENFPALDAAKAQRVALLSLREAIALLSEPLEVEAETIDGKPPTKRAKREPSGNKNGQSRPPRDAIVDDEGSTGIPDRELRDKPLDDRSNEILPVIETVTIIDAKVAVLRLKNFVKDLMKQVSHPERARLEIQRALRELIELI